MATRSLVLMILTACLALFGCGDSDRQRLTLTGSSTVAPLAAEIAKRFEQQNQGIRVDVQTGGSSRGINDVRSGLADIGMASRALKPDEADLVAHTIAWDGITVILNTANPVMNLDHNQIIAIYTGQVNNWQALGGPERPITVVNKAEGRSTLELFLAHFQLKNADIAADIIIGDNQQGLKTVAGNPWAIGYVSIGAAEYEAQQGAPIRLLAMAGIEPTLEAVESGRFPIARALNLVTRGEPTPLQGRFIAFARSPAAADLVRQQFFIPIHADQS